jgi:hypothetical protein
MKTILALSLLALSGCTIYNVKAELKGPNGTLVGPVLSCSSAVQQDEGGVCWAFYGCSDGKDYTHCEMTQVP